MIQDPSLSKEEIDQLIRVLFTAKHHTPIIAVSLGESPLAPFLEQPLGPKVPCPDYLKQRCNEWIAQRIRASLEREFIEEIKNAGQLSYGIALINIQIHLENTWHNLAAFLQDKLQPDAREEALLDDPYANPNHKVPLFKSLKKRLEVLLNVGELCLEAYDRGEKKGLSNLTTDMQAVYDLIENHPRTYDAELLYASYHKALVDFFDNTKPNLSEHTYLHVLRVQLLQHAEKHMHRLITAHVIEHADILEQQLSYNVKQFIDLYLFIEKIQLATHDYHVLSYHTTIKKLVAEWLQDRIQAACALCGSEEAGHLSIARNLTSAVKGAIIAINADHLATHTIAARLFNSKSRFALNLTAITTLYPLFYSFDVILPRVPQKTNKLIMQITKTSTKKGPA